VLQVTIILRAAPENPLTEDLAELFSEYASLLAAQGELTVAYQYAQVRLPPQLPSLATASTPDHS
jgi:hypothetical protein